jgi:hypothetical protein
VKVKMPNNKDRETTRYEDIARHELDELRTPSPNRWHSQIAKNQQNKGTSINSGKLEGAREEEADTEGSLIGPRANLVDVNNSVDADAESR